MRPIRKDNPDGWQDAGEPKVEGYIFFGDLHKIETKKLKEPDRNIDSYVQQLYEVTPSGGGNKRLGQINMNLFDLLKDYSEFIKYKKHAEWKKRNPRKNESAYMGPQGNYPFLKIYEEAKLIINNMERAMDQIYRDSKRYLIRHIDCYCSFCEIKLPDYVLQVEHRVPKSDYPYLYLSWENFLLACGHCNSCKGDRPNRGEIKGWSIVPAPTSDRDFQDAIEKHYVWPDKAPSGTQATYNSYNRFNYKLWDIKDDISLDIRSSLDNYDKFKEKRSGHIFVRVENAGTVEDHEVRIRIFEKPSYDMYFSQDTLNLLGLNDTKKTKVEERLPSVFERTKNWHHLMMNLRNAINIVNDPNVTDAERPDKFKTQWDLFLQDVKQAGFYSTILASLSFIEDPIRKQAMLSARFIHDTDPANYDPDSMDPDKQKDPSLIFWGTNTNNML